MKARERPQRGQRLYFLTLNFGFLAAFTINDVLAISILPKGNAQLF